MEEVKILILALVTFLSQENLPITAKSAEIHIDRANRQVTIKQYDLVSVEQYRELAKAGLDSLMQARTLLEDMAPLRLTHTSFYEEDDRLNAVLYLQYDELKDLRKMSFYADAEDNLSYPYMDSFTYDLQTGRIDGRHVRFDQGQDVKFKMEGKQAFPEGIYSLLDDWKALEMKKYINMEEDFSKKDFEALRKFIFKNGDRRTYRNFDNHNPHYRFEGFDVYLGTGDQRNIFNPEKNKITDYTELVIQDKGYYTLYLTTANTLVQPSLLTKNKVYWHNPQHLEKELLSPYLEKMLSKIKNN